MNKRIRKMWITWGVAMFVVVAACGGTETGTSATTSASTTTVAPTPTTATPAPTTSPPEDTGPLPAALDIDEMTIIVNQSPGGGADLAARILEPVLERQLGIEVLVENITEASGVQGSIEIFNSDPDGSVVGALLLPRTIQQEILLDADYVSSEFAPVLTFRTGAFALTVAADSPIQDLDDLIAAAEQNPINVGVTGPGSATDLQAARLADALGVEFVRVPFDGAAPVRTAVLGGHIDAGMLPLNQDILNDQYRILLVPTGDRFFAYPELPVMSDFGMEAADVNFYQGIFGPKGMTEDVRAALEEVFRNALADPETVQRFEDAGFFSFIVAGDEMVALMDSQREIINTYIALLQG